MSEKLRFDCGNRNEYCDNVTICPCLLFINKMVANIDNKGRCNIIDGYKKLFNQIIADFSSEERIIIEHPDIGTVRDGGKRFYADECKRMLAELATKYYSTENMNKLTEYKSVLKLRLENEYNYENEKTTERIAKNWAVHSVIRDLEFIERYLCELV